MRGGYLCLREDPLETFDGQTPHVLYGIGACHDDIHARKTTHRAHIYYVLLHFAITEPGGHQMFETMDGGWGYGGLLVGLGDAHVEGDKPLVFAGDIDTRLQAGVVDGETLYDFHSFVYFLQTFDKGLGDVEGFLGDGVPEVVVLRGIGIAQGDVADDTE